MLLTGPVSLPSSVAHQSVFVETHKLTTGVEEDSSSLRAQSSSKADKESERQVEGLAAATSLSPPPYLPVAAPGKQYKRKRAKAE